MGRRLCAPAPCFRSEDEVAVLTGTRKEQPPFRTPTSSCPSSVESLTPSQGMASLQSSHSRWAACPRDLKNSLWVVSHSSSSPQSAPDRERVSARRRYFKILPELSFKQGAHCWGQLKYFLLHESTSCVSIVLY